MQGAPGYREKAILASQVLEATAPVAGRDSDIYRAVHDLFSAMPTRLVRGSVFLVTTQDVEDGVELAWDAREEARPGYESGQGLLAAYDPDEPLARALATLERVCNTRAGYVRTSYEELTNSSSFPRRPYLHRRVVARLPLTHEAAEARLRARQAEKERDGPLVSLAPPSRPKGPRQASWPVPIPLGRLR